MNIIRNICLSGGPILLQFIKYLTYQDIVNISNVDKFCGDKICNNKNLWRYLHIEKFGISSQCMELYYKKLSSSLYDNNKKSNNFVKIMDGVKYADGNIFNTYYITYDDILYLIEEDKHIEIMKNVRKIVIADEIYILDNNLNLYIYADSIAIKILSDIKDIENYFFDRVYIINIYNECIIIDKFDRQKRQSIDIFLNEEISINKLKFFKLCVLIDGDNYSNQIKKFYYSYKYNDTLFVILLTNNKLIWLYQNGIGEYKLDIHPNIKIFTSLGSTTYFVDLDNKVYQKIYNIYDIIKTDSNIVKLEYSPMNGIYILCDDEKLYKYGFLNDSQLYLIHENVINYSFDEFKIFSFLIKY